MKLAVIQTGGKQYIVKENQELFVDNIITDKKELELPILLAWDDEKDDVEIGTPSLKSVAKVTVLDQLKGDKVRVMRFKAKTRYRKTTGFRPMLTKIKIVSI
jgi:large subunit ribosomal protein L21